MMEQRLISSGVITGQKVAADQYSQRSIEPCVSGEESIGHACVEFIQLVAYTYVRTCSSMRFVLREPRLISVARVRV